MDSCFTQNFQWVTITRHWIYQSINLYISQSSVVLSNRSVSDIIILSCQQQIHYVTQEAVCVVANVFRRYPGEYESVIQTLCENLEQLDEPEAKCSIIWVLGEYSERIDNSYVHFEGKFVLDLELDGELLRE